MIKKIQNHVLFYKKYFFKFKIINDIFLWLLLDDLYLYKLTFLNIISDCFSLFYYILFSLDLIVLKILLIFRLQ